MPEHAIKLLPNVRKLFIPDPGYVLIDGDLAGADAQVVAWEADDEDLKQAFKRGLKVHVKNATDMWGEEFSSLDPESHQWKHKYKQIKSGVHGTNYGVSPRTMAILFGWTITFAENFQKKWFQLHPQIKNVWHSRVRNGLQTSRSVSNRFGFRRYYFDRIDSIFPEALAWGPQSTVALTCFRGALNVREQLPWVHILLQVHDSLVMQIPKKRLCDIQLVQRALLNPIPYDDPLTIQWGLKLSPKSWGEVKEYKWEDAATLKL